ncbi:response regulator transcription factor [Pseudomonas sp. MYb118]|uniref:response regulator transcription factor n=1 Tax=Pseudomonas sp. MYb118 TaxID=1848720 RepID=UPI0034CD5712
MNQDSNTARMIVAIVDDDDSVRMALDNLLRSMGYKIKTYCSALAFLDSNDPAHTDCLISDIQMPGMSGLELHQHLLEMGHRIPTIFITAYPENLPQAISESPTLIAYLPKPCETNKLLSYIETALHQHR